MCGVYTGHQSVSLNSLQDTFGPFLGVSGTHVFFFFFFKDSSSVMCGCIVYLLSIINFLGFWSLAIEIKLPFISKVDIYEILRFCLETFF